MEKVCLVKRRQQSNQNNINYLNNDTPFDRDMPLIGNKTFPDHHSPVNEYNDQAGHFMCITMTPEQSNMLQNSDYIKKLLAGSLTDPALDVQCNNEGQIVLRFSVSESCLRMIRCDQVCQMIGISRSFLNKLIHDKTIKSYKLGRLRRFLMEDIINYIISSEENILCNTVRHSDPALRRS